MGRTVYALVVVALLAALAASPAAHASTATLNWEVEIATGTSVVIRALAVDQSTGDVYVMTTGGRTLKYSRDGVLLATIGPAIKDSAGVTMVNLGGGQPVGLAVDPLTGYLYLSINGSSQKKFYVVDTNNPSYPNGVFVYTTPEAKLFLNRIYNMAFSDDGQYLYMVGADTPLPSGGVRRLARDTKGTLEATDDTFNYAGFVDLNQTGVMLALGYGDPRGCTVDRDGRVYVSDMHGTKRPVRRYKPNSTELDLEFYAYTIKSWGCSTDSAGNFWVGDMDNPDSRMVRCFSGGIEVFAFDPGAGAPLSGQINYSNMVACDRARGRVIVSGGNSSGGATKGLLQSWSVTLDNPQLGTISGRVVDAGTGQPVPTVDSISIESPYRYPTSYGVTFYGLSSPGTFSYDVMPAVYNVRASSPGYLGSIVSHYEVLPGQTTTTADIPMLPSTSDYVTIQLGQHNIEQGLFLRSTVPGAFTDNSDNGSANFAASIGGRECRGFGRSENGFDENHMNFNVDDAFMCSGAPTSQAWVEVDLYDDGPDRIAGETNTAANVKYTNLGLIYKQGTMAWRKLLFARPDFYFGNQVYTTADFRLNSFPHDGGETTPPAGVDYVSRVTVRKTATAESYEQVSGIVDLKKRIVAQAATGDDRGAGGFAIELDDQLVTASLSSGQFYIQQGLLSGIRVENSAYIPEVGDLVSIKGSLLSDPNTQELCIKASPESDSVLKTGTGAAPEAIALSCRWAGGGPQTVTNYVQGVSYANQVQPGIGVGLSNVGMLVRIAGKVVSAGLDPLMGWFVYVDDGSRVRNETNDLGEQIGIRVFGDAVGSVFDGQNVICTGILCLGYSALPTEAPYHVPVLVLRNEGDLQLVP